MAANIKVVLFEDTKAVQSQIRDLLAKYLSNDGTVVVFDPGQFSETEAERAQTYENRIQNILTKPPFDDATIIVADRDLSKSVDAGFRGLSVNAVAAVAKRLAIPICSYARDPEPGDYDWRTRWEEGHIVLHFSEGEEDLARRAIIAAHGFAEIAATLPAVMKANPKYSAAKTMAALLGKPEFAEKIALYSVGDQNRLSEVLSQGKPEKREVKRLAHFLGYWLWDSLLRYPGLLVNEIAAGSYLDIADTDFHKSPVQAIFKEALYHGPFEDLERLQWWRGSLDDIVSAANFSSGLEFVRSKLGGKIGRSVCCVDESKSAGYYCIISRKPVSLENSKGGLSWFPRGADLTRISNPMFEEYGPWLGS
jgi:hypothetical protein